MRRGVALCSGDEIDELNRRNFAGMLASLLGTVALATTNAEGQATSADTAGSAPTARPVKNFTSGVFKPQAVKGMQDRHESHQFAAGMLTAGKYPVGDT